MKFPNTININTLKAYINMRNYKVTTNKLLNAFDIDCNDNSPDSLKILCVKVIAENWLTMPLYNELVYVDDRNYLLDILDINLPLNHLCAHIPDEIFWKRCFQHKYKSFCPKINGKKWIQMYLEKHCSDTIENMKLSQYDVEKIENLTELWALNVEEINVNQMQPSFNENNDHIPLDLILMNLNGLKKIILTFDVKNIETNFYANCSNISDNDIKSLCNGLKKCYELKEFRLHSTKLEPFMLKMLGNALDKGCRNLEILSFNHCRCGDIGLISFLEALSFESFLFLKQIHLTNNFLSQQSALQLAEAIKYRKIEKLDLRLNPLTSDGAAVIMSAVHECPTKELNLSCCSIDYTFESVLLHFLNANKSVEILNLSSNKFNKEFGQKIANVLSENKYLTDFDLRNTFISSNVKSIIDALILKNRKTCN